MAEIHNKYWNEHKTNDKIQLSTCSVYKPLTPHSASHYLKLFQRINPLCCIATDCSFCCKHSTSVLCIVTIVMTIACHMNSPPEIASHLEENHYTHVAHCHSDCFVCTHNCICNNNPLFFLHHALMCLSSVQYSTFHIVLCCSNAVIAQYYCVLIIWRPHVKSTRQ